VVSNIHCRVDKIYPTANPPRYPLQSNPHAMLIPPLNFDRRVHNNLVSASSTGAPATMSAPDNQPPGASDPDRQADLTDYGAIDDDEQPLGSPRRYPGVSCSASGQHRGLRRIEHKHNNTDHCPYRRSRQRVKRWHRGAESSAPRPPQPPRDHREDLRNSFHQPKIKFPRYDGESEPLPWLYRCESYFRSTRTLQAEQVWLASLHMDGAAAEWYYVLEREYSLVPWARF
jgi:hypothetical protein